MSLGKAVFPSIRYESKDWAGLTTRNHIGALFGEQPELIGDFISRLEYMDLGEDLISYMKQYPIHYVEDAEKEYEWMMQGAEEKNIPLVKATDIDGNAFTATSEIGKYGQRFLMWFGEKLFFKQHVIVGMNPDAYKLLVRSDYDQRGSYFVHEVELVTGDPELYIPYDEVTTGTKWSTEYSLSEQTLSKDGSDVSFTSPFRLGGRMSFIRKKHLVPGNMIDATTNSPVVFGVNGKDNKPITTWINKLDWVFRRQFRRESASLLMFGRSNRRSDGTYGNIGDSGYEIKAGSGLRDQISPSNIFYYTKFNIETLVDFCLSLSVGKLPQDSRNFVIGTGEHGLKMISRDIERYASASALDYGRITGITGGSQASFQRPQFVKHADINGIRLNFMHISQYDDDVRNKIPHPDGGLAESHRMTIMDFGTADGQPNIQLVRCKKNPEIFGYIPGLRDPYSPAGLGRSGKLMVTPVDGYEIHRADWLGILIRNSRRLAEFIPNVLY
jgi:hypothetical protein